MEAHDIAAHRIAQALTTIHAEFSVLTPHDRLTLAAAFHSIRGPSELDMAIDTAASLLTAAHPFEEPHEAQIDAYVDNQIDCLSDMRVKDYIDMLVPETAWEWRACLDEHRASIETELKRSEEDGDEDSVGELRKELLDWDELAEAAQPDAIS